MGYTLNSPLAAGASCTLQIFFSPGLSTPAGSYDRSLVLQTAAGSVSLLMLARVGELRYPIVVSPQTLTFSSAANVTETRTITLLNPAPTAANVTPVVLPSGYSRSGGTCPNAAFSLAPAASCTIIVTREATAPRASSLKSATVIDVPIFATTGSATLRIKVAVQPLVNIGFETQPQGLKIVVDGQQLAAPVTLQVEAGTSIAVEARDQNLGGNGWQFASWSDGGTAAHTVVAQSPGPTLTATFVAASLVAKLDIDNDGLMNAATDGLLILRYLSGVRGAALLADLPIPANAERRDSGVITAYLDGIRSELDVDGVGGTQALTDGMIIMRYMLGLSGASLTLGAGASGALSVSQIQAKLDLMRP